MLDIIRLTLLLLLSSWTHALSPTPEWIESHRTLTLRSFNITAALDLPPCVQACGNEILPQFHCLPGDPCYCNKTGPVSQLLTACVTVNCSTSLESQLQGAKFTADSCNYPESDQRTRTTRITANTLFALATLFIVMRMISRWPKLCGAGYKYDDMVVAACYVPTVGMLVVTHYTVKNGSGENVWELSVDMIARYMMWFMIGQIMLFLVFFGSKISLVLLYLRIWPPDGRRRREDIFRIACKITIVLLLLTMIASCLAVIFSCRPFDAYYKLWKRPTAHCTNSTDLHYAFAGINMSLDLLVLGLPIPRLAKLQIGIGQKLGIIATFLAGGLVTMCSIMRIYYLHTTYGTTNVTHDFSHAGLWGVIELNASMVTCCMPPTAGLIKRIWKKVLKPAWRSVKSIRISVTMTKTDLSGDSTLVETGGSNERGDSWVELKERERGGSLGGDKGCAEEVGH